MLRHVFERVVWAAMAMGLVKGEGFAVDASVLEANASRYHGKAPSELDWSKKQRQTRAVTEYLAALDEVAEPNPDRNAPKRSPSDQCSAWTAKANKRVQLGFNGTAFGLAAARPCGRVSCVSFDASGVP